MQGVIFTIFNLIAILFNFVYGHQKVPCYFIFGDSLSDPGNNNRLITMAKANYPPYGIDFPGAISTGRFTNGRTTVDFITEALGFDEFIKSFSSSNITNQDILRGVNFASGGAGILDQTGINLGARIPFNQQILNYKLIILKLQLLFQGSVDNYLKKCLFTIDIGSNDYINNYFLPQNNLVRTFFNPKQFAEKLATRYKGHLQALYNTGARKITVSGLGQLGCTLGVIATYNATQCVEEINQAVEQFNNKLVSLVDSLNLNLPGAQLTFFNITSITNATPLPTGFITNSPCCTLRSDFQCEPFTRPCPNRDIYAFMDGFHPTQIVCQGFASIMMNTTNRSFVHPFNIKELIGQ